MTPPPILLAALSALSPDALEALRARLDEQTEREEIAADEGTDATRVQPRGDA